MCIFQVLLRSGRTTKRMTRRATACPEAQASAHSANSTAFGPTKACGPTLDRRHRTDNYFRVGWVRRQPRWERDPTLCPVVSATVLMMSRPPRPTTSPWVAPDPSLRQSPTYWDRFGVLLRVKPFPKPKTVHSNPNPIPGPEDSGIMTCDRRRVNSIYLRSEEKPQSNSEAIARCRPPAVDSGLRLLCRRSRTKPSIYRWLTRQPFHVWLKQNLIDLINCLIVLLIAVQWLKNSVSWWWISWILCRDMRSESLSARPKPETHKWNNT